MLEIFDSSDSPDRGGRSHVKLDNLLVKQVKAVDNAIDYYKVNPTYVNASHKLVRLCQILDGRFNTSASDSFITATNEHDTICTMLGFTSEINPGEVDHDSFNFEKGSVYLANPVYPYVIDGTLRDPSITGVRMVYRDGIESAFEVPAVNSNPIKGFGMFVIDIPLFAANYWAWKENKIILNDEESATPDVFVSTAVLPYLIRDAVDLAYMNCMHKDFNASDVRGKSKTPFLLVDQFPSIVSELRTIKDSLGSMSIHHSNFMAEYPVMDKGSVYDMYMDLTGTISNINTNWAKFMASLPIVRCVLAMTPMDKDVDLKNRLRAIERRMKSTRFLSKAPDKDLVNDLYSQYAKASIVINSR